MNSASQAPLRLGISTYGLHPRDVVELAQDAEAAGFATVWMGEHVVSPRGYQTPHPRSNATVQHHAMPVAHESILLADPLATLAAAGACTSRIELATGMYVAPLRHPLAVARSVSTAQQLCGGRFLLGLGAGWLREEFAALGAPFESRFRRLEQTISILRESLDGRWVRRKEGEDVFDDVRLNAEPVPLRVVLGGNSGPALRRAARLADGWFSSGTPSWEEAVDLRATLEAAVAKAGRTTPLRQWFRAPEPVGLERYWEAGFEDVVVWADQVWPVADRTGRREVIADHGRRLGLTPGSNSS